MDPANARVARLAHVHVDGRLQRDRSQTFPNNERYDELVVVREIPFHSLCMHHLLPLHGVAHVAYVPGVRIVGLSKLGAPWMIVGD